MSTLHRKPSGNPELTVQVRVVEVDGDNAQGRGECIFVSLPYPGDRFVLGDVMGDLDVMEVLYVEHQVVHLPIEEGSCARTTPSARVFARAIEHIID